MTLSRISSSQFSGGPHPFQTLFWARVKKANSWASHFFELSETGRTVQFLVLVRDFIPGLMSLAYIPMCNLDELVISEGGIRQLASLLKKALPKSVFDIRFDFSFDYSNSMGQFSLSEVELESWYSKFASREGLVLMNESIQPQGTVMIDLSSDFEYRTRARRILKKNFGKVEVGFWNGDMAELDCWYDIYRETARKDGFTARSRNYIDALLIRSSAMQENEGASCRLLLARVNGEIKGGIITLTTDEEALYLFGGAIRNLEYNVSYCLQDFAIRNAVENGMKVYDLYGSHGTLNRAEHLGSLTQFKLAFGGRQIFRIPSCDFVCHRMIWKLYVMLEKRRLSKARD